MEAAVLNGIGKDLEVEEREIPTPDGNEILIKQQFTGICYRDILTKEGFFPRVSLPMIPGHELSGTIVEIGEDVEYFKKGDHVAGLIYVPCGHCENCISGNENLCAFKKTMGENIRGTYREYVTVNQRALVKVPQGVPEELATIAACVTGMATHALDSVAGISPGKRVLITGAGGGVGSHAIQIARAYGAEVTAVTSSQWKTEELYKLGADHVITASDTFSKDLKAIWAEGANIVMENTGSATFKESFRSLAFGGKMVVPGNLSPASPEIPLGILILKGNTVAGSISSTRNDMEKALLLSLKGKIKPVIWDRIDLKDVNTALKNIKEKKNVGRVLIKFS